MDKVWVRDEKVKKKTFIYILKERNSNDKKYDNVHQ